MPCRDYESDRSSAIPWEVRVEQMQKKMDRLARIACRAMEALEKVAPTDEVFYIEEQSEWWTAHKIADAKAMYDQREIDIDAWIRQEVAAKKQAAMARISKEDRKLLGL
jgi:NACalpha-BTF3-like transcription factor